MSKFNVRSAFTKGGGNMGTQGCVSFMFQEKGELVIEKEGRDEDEMMMLALEAEGIEFLEAAVKMIPDTYTAINEDDAKKF